MCSLSSVCQFVMRVCCDKTTKARITQFTLKSSPFHNVLHGKFDDKIQSSPLDQKGSIYDSIVFDFVALYLICGLSICANLDDVE